MNIAAKVNLTSRKNMMDSAMTIVIQSNHMFIKPVKIKSLVCSTSFITL